MIYNAPESLVGCESGSPGEINDLILAKTFCLEPSSLGCSTSFLNVASLLMHENSLQMPEFISDAQLLYEILIY